MLKKYIFIIIYSFTYLSATKSLLDLSSEVVANHIIGHPDEFLDLCIPDSIQKIMCQAVYNSLDEYYSLRHRIYQLKQNKAEEIENKINELFYDPDICFAARQENILVWINSDHVIHVYNLHTDKHITLDGQVENPCCLKVSQENIKIYCNDEPTVVEALTTEDPHVSLVRHFNNIQIPEPRNCDEPRHEFSISWHVDNGEFISEHEVPRDFGKKFYNRRGFYIVSHIKAPRPPKFPYKQSKTEQGYVLSEDDDHSLNKLLFFMILDKANGQEIPENLLDIFYSFDEEKQQELIEKYHFILPENT